MTKIIALAFAFNFFVSLTVGSIASLFGASDGVWWMASIAASVTAWAFIAPIAISAMAGELEIN